MDQLTLTIDCPKFRTLGELVESFGTDNPSENGTSCTGCPRMKLIGGLMTCKYLHDHIDKTGGIL